ncbi:hypothetical protein L915_09220 [Phytophthora nicotianae]|uniref:RxLR effector protein n=2 Tax=Phytophthora nicotianae TaxID=4792 RepID=W2GUW8_PHYNI|nr:hypothetical protein L915_09220 [Phytophthora nicotianae]
MRLFYVVLLTMSTLLLSCGSALATDGNEGTRSPNVGHSINSGPTNNANRMLRVSKETGDGENVAAEEERAGQGLLNKFLGRNDLTKKTLSRMMKDEAFKRNMFKNWDKHRQSVGKIREKMFLELNPRYKKLLLEYLNEYKRTAPKLKKFKPRKPSTGNRVRFAEA